MRPVSLSACQPSVAADKTKPSFSQRNVVRAWGIQAARAGAPRQGGGGLSWSNLEATEFLLPAGIYMPNKISIEYH